MSPASPRLPPSKPPTDEPPAASVLDQVTHGYVLLDEAIIELADADRISGVAMLIAERVGMLPDTIVRALRAPAEEPVAVLCRAAGLGVNGFSAVLRMRRRGQPDRDASPSQALAGFLQMPIEMAQRVVRMLKVTEER